ncbi:MAG: hypothetical protein CMQ71_00390 [Gammaproteobacteria bacterium]|nr:hypothetical protein [Gammaproteobacteria bacterium]|tara:strand:- start:675 stop:1628 length:954 start_codon:yes stop_codon:yes gene_type:complete
MKVNFNCEHCGKSNAIDIPGMDSDSSEEVQKLKKQLDLERMKTREEKTDKENETIYELRKQLEEEKIKSNRSQAELEKTSLSLAKVASKSDSPSMEIQGEVAEEVLQKMLEEAFPNDAFKPIKKGQAGADVKQTVMMPSGHEAGVILYESKNTKNWSNQWIEKLRADMQEDGATLGMLVSVAFPAKEKEIFVQIEERIFLCKPGIHVASFARALREAVLMGARKEILDEFSSKDSKDNLYEYITGDFIEQISNIARTHSNLTEEMQKEKNAFKKKWSAREKTLEQLANSMTGIVGSISGIGVQSMKLDKIKELSMDE